MTGPETPQEGKASWDRRNLTGVRGRGSSGGIRLAQLGIVQREQKEVRQRILEPEWKVSNGRLGRLAFSEEPERPLSRGLTQVNIGGLFLC